MARRIRAAIEAGGTERQRNVERLFGRRAPLRAWAGWRQPNTATFRAHRTRHADFGLWTIGRGALGRPSMPKGCIEHVVEGQTDVQARGQTAPKDLRTTPRRRMRPTLSDRSGNSSSR